jgi:hypothetical protein
METVMNKDMNKETMSSKTQKQDIIFILDESGSMATMGSEPKDSVNRLIKEQKELDISGTKFTLVKFNSKVNVVYNDLPLEDIPKFTDYYPSDMTALYDAIGMSINNKRKNEEYDNVICVILTDGMENSSKEFDCKTIKNMIKEMEDKHKWKFVYVAANQDAFSVGETFGVKNCANFIPTGEGFCEMTREISCGISRFRSGESDSVQVSTSDDVPKTPTHEPKEPTSPPRLVRSKRVLSPFRTLLTEDKVIPPASIPAEVVFPSLKRS